MHKYLLTIFICVSVVSCKKPPTDNNKPSTPTVTTANPKPVSKTNSQKVYVHYLPWFETPATNNGAWGQHWTMANENPNIILGNGRRQIASFFYPMIGPYDSDDRDVIDYHLLLMKYAGIDGLIVDWYGTHNVYDYPLNKRNTDSIFSRVPNSGLQFGICYEDATLANDKAIANIDSVPAAQQDFAYLQSNYFSSSNYITISGQPLLLDFGPQGLTTPAQWTKAFSQLSPKPWFETLEYQSAQAGSNANGEFAWVESNDQANLQGFYQTANTLHSFFAGAYPGFKDFYQEGGWGSTLFLINYDSTTTLQNCLNLAKSSGTNYLQLITWNDYGEGTMIEPTLDYNFSFLQTIQQYTGVTYTVTELQLIYKWYTLRKKYVGNTAVELQLTNAYNDLVGLDVGGATGIIGGIN